MITVVRAGKRHHELRGRREVWHTFHAAADGATHAEGFAALEVLDEYRVPPGTSLTSYQSHDAEVVTYVCDGALACEDSTGRSGVIQAGEFQRMTIGRGVRQRKSNASRSEWAHAFQFWMRRPEAGPEQRYEQKRFTAAVRRGRLCVVASPDARRGSLLTRDTLVYSSLLAPGQHVAHALASGRCAWLHVVRGELTLGETVLVGGDGAGVTEERSVPITARENSEILLCDLGYLHPLLPSRVLPEREAVSRFRAPGGSAALERRQNWSCSAA